jgi:dipeptidyl aminopeptidase/acylaminoacyl peptidase
MKRWRLSFAALLALPNAAGAQERVQDSILRIRNYLSLRQISDPQVSPDGSKILFTQRAINPIEDRWESSVYLMNADGGRRRFLLRGSNARWSPDGSRIVYLSNSQIFVRYMDGEDPGTQLTNLSAQPSNPTWSPDGKFIAFRMAVPNRRTWRIDLPERPEGARWTPEPRIIEKTNYRADGVGFLADANVHIFIISVDGGTARQITKGDWSVGSQSGTSELCWTPDGRQILFDGVAAEDADTRYRESYINAVDVATGGVRHIVTTKGGWRSPVVSPDGRMVAFVGYEWTPATFRTSDLRVIGVDGTGMRDLTASFDRDPGDLHWARDNSGVYFGADNLGSRNLYFASLRGSVQQLSEGVHMLREVSYAESGTALAVRASAYEPGDVVRVSLDGPKQIVELTHANDDWLSQIKMGKQEEVWYPSTNGMRIQGWIVTPPNFDPTKKYPLILDIHGGPHANWNVAFNFRFQYWAANGYIAFFPNHRGSVGYGGAFANAIDSAHPGDVAFDDLMKGVDALLARGYVDPNNLYVLGGSDGGSLTAWVVGHTDRFAAAISRYPVIDWISFAGTSDITQWGYQRFRNTPWENPDPWLRHSPLMYVGNIKTPTAIMTGELDLRTPISQSEELYQALRNKGVPTVLIRFANEYHGTMANPSNFMRTQLYSLSWMRRWARPAGGT